MALEGTFSDFGVAEILQLIGLQKKTGLLTVKGGADDQVVTVSFEKGMVTFADEYQRGEKERLGSILIRSRLITMEALEKAIQTQEETLQRLGHVLVQMKLVSQRDLRQALQAQVKETVYRLFRWKKGSYHFSSESVNYDKEMYDPISTESLLMDGVRMIDEWQIIEKKITSFDIVYETVPGKELFKEKVPVDKVEGELSELFSDSGESVKPAGESDEGDSSSSLSVQEKSIYSLVDGRRTVQDIIDIGKLGEFETCRILFSFLSIGAIRSGGSTPSVRPGKPVPGRFSLPVGDIAVVAAAILFCMAVFLFGPWSMMNLNGPVDRSREEIGALRDDLKIRRLHHGLEVFYLEKQSYPSRLDKLVEDELLNPDDLRDHLGRTFMYGGGEKDYTLGKE